MTKEEWPFVVQLQLYGNVLQSLNKILKDNSVGKSVTVIPQNAKLDSQGIFMFFMTTPRL